RQRIRCVAAGFGGCASRVRDRRYAFMSARFADRLIEGIRQKNSPLCVGLDPMPDRIPSSFGELASISALQDFCQAIVEIASKHAAVLKPQVGFFEPFGPDGVRAAMEACAAAQARGMMVLLDAKRGDIGSTAEGYARATLGVAPGFNADCATVNPYL